MHYYTPRKRAPLPCLLFILFCSDWVGICVCPCGFGHCAAVGERVESEGQSQKGEVSCSGVSPPFSGGKPELASRGRERKGWMIAVRRFWVLCWRVPTHLFSCMSYRANWLRYHLLLMQTHRVVFLVWGVFLCGFFWPPCAACGILVPQPGIEPRPWQWKHQVLTGTAREFL